MKKVILYVGLAVLATVFIAWKLNSNKKKNRAETDHVKESLSGAVPVQVDTVTYTTLEEPFLANGNFEPLEQIQLTSEVAGRIQQLYVEEGSIIKEGQMLARVDSEVLAAARMAAQAKLTQSKADLTRYEKAFSSGGVTEKQVDDIRLQVETDQSKYIHANKDFNKAIVKSPANGVINERFIEVGSYVALGDKLFDIVDPARLKLSVNVSEFEVIGLKNGDQVRVTASVYPEVTYSGVISFIAAKGDAALNYAVEIAIQNVAGRSLKGGMYGTAHFASPVSERTILVPRSSFQGGVNSSLIFLAQKGRAKLHKVIAGRSIGNKVEVREGLKENDIIITSGQINLVDLTPITVVQ